MSKLKLLNLALRGLMEFGIITAFGYWGYYIGNSMMVKILLCVSVPLVSFGFWGLVDFHQFGEIAESLRLIQELLITGLAACALFSTGAFAYGWILVVVSVIHHTLVYLLGDKLIKNRK
jgi:Protein of unknown function (DUF2568)